MELKKYFIPLIKWWWLIAAATLAAGISSYLTVSQQPPIYQARVTLLVGRAIENPNPSSSDFSVGQQLASTYVNIANTQQMRRSTAEALGLSRLPEYAVQLVPNTQLIVIAVTDTSPERTQSVANELARQLVLQSPTAPTQEEEERRKFVEEQLAGLQDDIRVTEEEISSWQEQLNELISAREIQNAETQIGALQAKLGTLQSIYASLISTTEGGATNTISIIDPATLPARAIGPNIVTTVLTAAAVGFVLAAAAAYVLDYLDDTVKTADDVKRISGLPTLAGISRINLENQEYKVVGLEDQRSPAVEGFRALRTGIQFLDLEETSRTLMITSSNPSEGKSLVAANLAVVLAQAANRVLLIDADLHWPIQHKIFNLSYRQGLTTLISLPPHEPGAAGDGNLDNKIALAKTLIQETSQPGLHVITSGPYIDNPSELLSSFSMKLFLDTLSAKFDYLILDSPPVLAVSDAIVLSKQVDSVIILVDTGKTRRKQFKEAVNRLREVRADLVGAILNRVETTSGYSYYPYYGKNREQRIGNFDASEEMSEDRVAVNGNGKSNGLLFGLRSHRKR